MATTVWKTIFKELPVNNQVVWVRVLNVYGEITLAKYKATQEKFKVQTTGIKIPVYQVSRWKPQ